MSSVRQERGENDFPRSVRLLTKNAYQQVFHKPEKISDKNFTILYRVTDNRSRLGLAIAKKKVAKAVDRNKLKRIVREHFRRNQNSDLMVDMVVLANSGSAKRSKKELNDSLINLWLRLKNR